MLGPSIIGIPRRSRFSDVDEGRAVAAALLAARGNAVTLPVVHGGRIVGFVRGEHWTSPRVAFQKVPAQYRMTWSNYNDVIASLSSSQRLTVIWHKTATTAGVANNWYDLWPVTGNPTAGSLAGAANTAAQWSDTSTGAIYTGGNKSPSQKYLLSTWANPTANTPTIMLYDRVLDYQSNAYTAAANQNMTNGVTAQRYVSSGQPGLQMTWATDTVHNATASNITTLTYDTPTASGHTMPTTPTVSIIVSAAAPTTTLGSRVNAPSTSANTITWGAFLPLANGDTGVKLVSNYTTSAANTGTFVLALIYPIAYIPCPAAGMPIYFDEVFQISSLERIYDGACLAAMSYQTATTAYHVTGDIDVGWG